ncbi:MULTISPECIES: tripartite tricarboxylate transporter TctB family protein [unclassified Variovorax]|jgi:putative tricarboxylic transport membrane protein|uniref:tripartite tricarboxylate transporter TctB family protein n=1 Tax=unclassified Variovorax TaxID=663243 RepID=UPI002B224E7F|nr:MULTISPECIES: tripartite tricarboxylate transporter TctB family protein [unclassified Variovorax]MEB0057637.1 tripartite tricarboxylate transporter TctB family protein [Variovorax sp. LG9.2]MEB0113434.1 tripartite tricarboxylate transporter TctB family protein [Variovorax sp. RTB1]
MTTTEPSAFTPLDAEPPRGPVAVWPQTLVGIGVLLTGLALGFGAIGISSEAGYGGVGPNFLPWLVSIVLTICGGWILWEARRGGFRELDAPSGAEHAYWAGFVWVSAGLLLNAALITTLGFIVSCTLCYVLAVQGLRRASGVASSSPRTWALDVVTGVLIAAPVFWTFTQFLAINLPGLTSTGWL